jgi:hypothetical protein
MRLELCELEAASFGDPDRAGTEIKDSEQATEQDRNRKFDVRSRESSAKEESFGIGAGTSRL